MSCKSVGRRISYEHDEQREVLRWFLATLVHNTPRMDHSLRLARRSQGTSVTLFMI